MTNTNPANSKQLTRYTVSMLDMTTYRRTFLAESDVEALAMADIDQEQNGACLLYTSRCV